MRAASVQGHTPRNYLLRFGNVTTVARGAGSRRTHEQLAAIPESQVAAVALVRTVFGLITINDDFSANGQRILRESSAEQSVRGATLNHPYGAILELKMNPSVWVNPLHFDDSAFKMNRRIRIKLSGECMMGYCGNCGYSCATATTARATFTRIGFASCLLTIDVRIITIQSFYVNNNHKKRL